MEASIAVGHKKLGCKKRRITTCACTRCNANEERFDLCHFNVFEELRTHVHQKVIEFESHLMDLDAKTPKLIHVLSSHGSKLDDFVVNELRKIAVNSNVDVTVKLLTLSMIRKDNIYWTETRIIQYLIECHCYFIISHPHQGKHDVYIY
jgi:hypothetical protein